MPKITVRDDGTAYTRAAIYPGSAEVRQWEVRREGVAWLRKRGIGVEQQMGRRLFDQLRKLGYAYIANPSGKRTPTTHRKQCEITAPSGVSVTTEEGPKGTRRVITIPANLVTSRGKPAKRKGSKPPESAANAPIDTAPDRETAKAASPLPAHWQRRTKKKAWFD